VNDENKRILILTPTTRGSMHDKKQFDKSGLGDVIPKGVTVWTDTGYQGLSKNFNLTHMQPKKRKKGTSLTDEEKINNRTISSIRIVSEQAIGGMKRMNSTTAIYRNKKAGTDDKLMLVSAGIWNLLIA
jgi:hypothetical protein